MLQSKHSSRGAIEEFIVFSKSTLEDTAAIGAPIGTKFLSRYNNKLQTIKRGSTNNQNKKEVTAATIENESNSIKPLETAENLQDNLKVAEVSLENILRKASLRKRLGESVPDYAFVSKNKSLDECDLAALTSKLERLKTETEDVIDVETKTTVTATVENESSQAGPEASSFECNVVDVHPSLPATSTVYTSEQETNPASKDLDPSHDHSSSPCKTNRARSFPPYNQNEPNEDSNFHHDHPQPCSAKANLYSSWTTNPQYHLSDPVYRNDRETHLPERRNLKEDSNQFSFKNQAQNQRYPMSQQENYPYPNRESQFELRNYDSSFQSQTLGRRQLSSSAVRKSEAFKRRTKSVEAVDGYRAKSSILNSTIEEEPERLALAKSSSLSIDCVDSRDQDLELNSDCRKNFSQSIPAFHDNYRLSPGSSGMSWMNTRSLANIDEDSRYEEANFCSLDRSNKLNSRSYGSFLDRESTEVEPRSSSLGPNSRNSSNSYGNTPDGIKYTSRQHSASIYNQDVEPWMIMESASTEAPSATFSRRSIVPVREVNYGQRYDDNIYEHIYKRVDSEFHPKRHSSSSLKELGGRRSYENADDGSLTKSQNIIVSRYTPVPNLDRNDRQYADLRYKYEAGHATLPNYSGCHFSSNPVNVSRTQAYVGSSPKRMHPERMHPGGHPPYHQQNYPPLLPPPPLPGNFGSHYVDQPPQFMYPTGGRPQSPAYVYSKPNVFNTPQQFLPRQSFSYQTNPHPAEFYPFHPANRRPTPLQEAYQKRAAALECNRNSSQVSQPPEQLPASILVRKDGAGVTSEIFPDTSRLWRRGDVKFASDPHVRMGDQHFRNNRSSSSKSGRKVTLVL